MNTKTNIPVRFLYPQGKEMVRFANQFAFSQIEMDIFMDSGIVDPQRVLEINQRIQSNTLQPDDLLECVVFQRVGMSLSTFIKLKQQIDQIFQNLEKQGVLVKKPETGQLQ